MNNRQQAILKNLEEMQASLFLLDWDGVGVPVLKNNLGEDVFPREVVATVEFRNAFFDFAEKNPESVAILTGRALREEIFYCLTAQEYPGGLDALLDAAPSEILQRLEVLLNKHDFPGGIERFLLVLNQIPIMTAHGYKLFYQGKELDAPLPEGEEHTSLYARKFGEVFEEIRLKIIRDHDKILTHENSPALKIIFETLLSRIQPDRWNLNFLEVPVLYKSRIIDAVGAVLTSICTQYQQPISELMQKFLADICAIAEHPLIDVVFNDLHSDKDFCLPEDGVYKPLKLGGDPSDGTYLEVKGSSNKGQNLLHWLKTLDLIHKPVRVVSDQLQALSEPGGDRLLVQALEAVIPTTMWLWQSLDGGDKQPLNPADPFYKYTDWIFASCYDFQKLFILNSQSTDLKILADSLANNEFENINFIAN